MVTGLPKFSFEPVRQKASSPKLNVLNTALMTAQHALSFRKTREDGEQWGRLAESAVGAHLINGSLGSKVELSYWREGNKEVDFILRKNEAVLAIEVKSGKKRESLPGMDMFAKRVSPQKKLLVGGDGIPLEEFLSRSPDSWF